MWCPICNTSDMNGLSWVVGGDECGKMRVSGSKRRPLCAQGHCVHVWVGGAARPPPPPPPPTTTSTIYKHSLSFFMCREEGRGQSIHRHPPKQLLQNVISGIFPCSTHRVYRLEISCLYIRSCWYFRPSFVICTLPCCHSHLLSGSTLPPPFPVWKITGTYLYKYKIARPPQIYTCRKVPLQVSFFRWWHFALPSMSLIFPTFQNINYTYTKNST
jgi:hypothetical protein